MITNKKMRFKNMCNGSVSVTEKFDQKEFKKYLKSDKEMERVGFPEHLIKKGDYYVCTGYANTKNRADRYGDIPTGDDVYQLDHYLMNRVVLIDHKNSASMIVGKTLKMYEDEHGLNFTAMIKDQNQAYKPEVKEVIDNLIYGFCCAVSIGGYFEYDKREPSKLIKVDLHEISFCGVPADPYSIITRETNDNIYNDDVRSLAKRYIQENLS